MFPGAAIEHIDCWMFARDPFLEYHVFDSQSCSAMDPSGMRSLRMEDCGTDFRHSINAVQLV